MQEKQKEKSLKTYSHICEYVKKRITFASSKQEDMIVTFEKEYLIDLYETGKSTDKKHRYQPQFVAKYIRCVDMLIGAPNVEALYVINSLNYEMLKGDKKGISSIRVDNKYRIEFTVSEVEETEIIITVCNIIELSNHYK